MLELRDSAVWARNKELVGKVTSNHDQQQVEGKELLGQNPSPELLSYFPWSQKLRNDPYH